MDNRRKILIVAAALYIGGAEKVARDIGMFADPDRFEVHYLVFGDKVGEYEQELSEHGCRIIHIDPPSEGYVSFIKTLRKLIRQNRYDVVHAHTMFNIGLVMFAAWKEKVPIRIAHAHSSLNDGGGIIKRVYEKVMRHLILRYSTDLIACGEAAGYRLYGEKTFKKRGLLILNGIDTEKYKYSCSSREMIREQLHLQESFIVGHVGHFAAVKNQGYLLRLMPEILKRRNNTKLLLLGDGEDRPELERSIKEMGLESSVVLTGNVRNVSDYLSAMDVFAFPSLYEGMPLSIVEVQANGLPCVLSTGVPKDVYLTDLVQPVSLDYPDKWVELICSLKRGESEKYSDQLNHSGFETSEIMKKYYEIYERSEL